MNAIPVISSLALGQDYEYYNVNADEMAAACAVAIKADALVFLTDVPGVKSGDGTVMRWLPVGEITALKDQGVISDGMLPKLDACKHAVANGVTRTRILPADAAEHLPDLFIMRNDLGTEIIAGQLTRSAKAEYRS